MNKYTDGEYELIRLKPHPLAFSKYAFLWLYFILISILLGLLLSGRITEIKQSEESSLLIAWIGSILLPMLFISVFTFKFSFFFWGVIIVGCGLLIDSNADALEHTWNSIIAAEFFQSLWEHIGRPRIESVFFLPIFTFVCAILGYIILEIHRLSHTYILTNQRIIARVGLFKKRVRDILYSHTEEIVVSKGFLGRMFNFGCVIPLGEKLQQNVYLPAGETKTGRRRRKIELDEKVIVLPRKASFFVIWQVPDPEKISNLISKKLGRTGDKVTKMIKFSQPEPDETVIRTISK